MIATPSKIDTYRGAGGYQLAMRYFEAVGAPQATVVLLHGIISHAGWYESSGRYLASRGFNVSAMDRRGSGLNSDARGDIDNWQTWIADVVAVCETYRQQGPVVLLGISWGGKLAPAVARDRPDLLSGFGMICPGIYAKQQPGLAKRTAVAASGKIGLDERRVTIPLQDPELFTDSPRWQTFVRDDPLTLRQVTMRFAREDHKLTRYVRHSPKFIHTPALLVLAGRDRMVQSEPTRRYMSDLASEDKTVLEYQSAAHTLEFEPDPEPFFDDLADWIARVARRRKV
jgi:alpha-beta hydrolase superfamily lysophospholipase